MDKAAQKKINNNNRKRGGAFEKRGADYLDMDVVPYSGSNARFGYGDVRDSIWLGEFKNITPKDSKVTIKIEWFDKNEERAGNINHLSFIAWMPAGKADKYVMVNWETFSKMDSQVYYNIELQTKHNTKNIIFDITDNIFKDMRRVSTFIGVMMGDRLWVIMSMETFRYTICIKGLKGERSTV